MEYVVFHATTNTRIDQAYMTSYHRHSSLLHLLLLLLALWLLSLSQFQFWWKSKCSSWRPCFFGRCWCCCCVRSQRTCSLSFHLEGLLEVAATCNDLHELQLFPVDARDETGGHVSQIKLTKMLHKHCLTWFWKLSIMTKMQSRILEHCTCIIHAAFATVISKREVSICDRSFDSSTIQNVKHDDSIGNNTLASNSSISCSLNILTKENTSTGNVEGETVDKLAESCNSSGSQCSLLIERKLLSSELNTCDIECEATTLPIPALEHGSFYSNVFTVVFDKQLLILQKGKSFWLLVGIDQIDPRTYANFMLV
ncbi:unnamed protein product [Vicia faba]|uniref:Uncharacterized protein n=1 Tax=Vicia faba TaxID=3906 RepID=A0AAV0YRA6_VICFA|nr:unnamed protein product [Vicia faba]